jgi:hypothetical protein
MLLLLSSTKCALFAWLISHQPAVLFSHNKPATSNQPAVLFSQNKPAPAISHQPTEQADGSNILVLMRKNTNQPLPGTKKPLSTEISSRY